MTTAKPTTVAVLEFLLYDIERPGTVAEIAAEAGFAQKNAYTQDAVAASIATLVARGIVEPAENCRWRIRPDRLAAAVCGLRDETPAADWTTGAYVSDVSRADHGRVAFKVPGGPDRIESATVTVTVDGSEATTRLLAGMLGQKGVLRFHVGEADHDLAGALADRRAEVTRLRELLVAAQESMGLQVVRVERGHGTVIICAPKGTDEKAISEAIGTWVLDEGMRHPDVMAEQRRLRRGISDAMLMLNALHMIAAALVNAVDDSEETRALVERLRSALDVVPAHYWEDVRRIAEKASASMAAETTMPAPEQA